MARSRRRNHASDPLRLRELAVDPADVDRDRYPVTIRLSRRMTDHEIQALAAIDPGVRALGDVIVVDDAKLDDIAHAHGEWTTRLESVEARGEELAGEYMIADQRRADSVEASGSHLGERHDPYFMH